MLGEPAAAIKPGDGALDDPALGQNGESFAVIGAPDDFDFKARQNLRNCAAEARPLVSGVGDEPGQKRMQSKQGCEQQDSAVAILDVKQQAQSVYEYMALLALDLLAGVIAVRIDARPPFSALFTLWLSMMAAVGLASRSPCSRHAMNRA